MEKLFTPFPKIARMNRDMIVTEKLDGTNAAVVVSDDGLDIWAQSRTRLIEPGNDNYGFAAWVQQNRDELLKLGPGTHFGEWWGRGIQKRYKSMTVKKFSLFNVSRWTLDNVPSCCSVVPMLYSGPFDTGFVNRIVAELRANGSFASPGDPCEGVVVFLPAGNILMKVTCEQDESYKGASEN